MPLVSTAAFKAESAMETTLATTAYSHEATVAAISSFYEFIKHMYGDVVQLKYPPEGGWPQITDLGGVWKPTPAVLELLRHIPYFVSSEWDPPVLLEGAQPVTWLELFEFLAREMEKEKWKREQTGAASVSDERDAKAEDDEDLPPHIIELAMQYRYGYSIFIDTQRGVVIWWDSTEREPSIGSPEGDAEPEDDGVERWATQGWKGAPTFHIETFFEMCKEQYKLLVSVAVVPAP